MAQLHVVKTAVWERERVEWRTGVPADLYSLADRTVSCQGTTMGTDTRRSVMLSYETLCSSSYRMANIVKGAKNKIAVGSRNHQPRRLNRNVAGKRPERNGQAMNSRCRVCPLLLHSCNPGSAS